MMGGALSAVNACSATVDDDESWLMQSIGYQSGGAVERERGEREQRICEEIGRREQSLADLQADAGALEREAVRHKQSAERYARGSRQYELALGNARRSLLAVQKKRALIAKERKLLDIANTVVDRMRVVDKGGDDSRFIDDLRQMTQTVNVVDQTLAATETQRNANAVLDDADKLLHLEQTMVDAFADLEDPQEGRGTLVLDGETVSLTDDNDLLRALAQLEDNQSAGALRERSTTTYSPMPERTQAAPQRAAAPKQSEASRPRLSQMAHAPRAQAMTATQAPAKQPLACDARRADDDPYADFF